MDDGPSVTMLAPNSGVVRLDGDAASDPLLMLTLTPDSCPAAAMMLTPEEAIQVANQLTLLATRLSRTKNREPRQRGSVEGL